MGFSGPIEYPARSNLRSEGYGQQQCLQKLAVKQAVILEIFNCNYHHHLLSG
jgi:hypothetical protein